MSKVCVAAQKAFISHLLGVTVFSITSQAVRLESWKEEHRRYLVIISTTGRQDTEESIIVGCDFETKKSTTCTIGLVLPLWCDTNITLDGDG